MKTSSFSFKGVNRESIFQYAIFISATFILGHISELTDFIAKYLDIEVATAIMAVIAVVLKKYVLPTPTVKSKE